MFRRCFPFAALSIALTSAWCLAAEDEIFSGPQAGEKLAAFSVQGVFDEAAGKKLEPLKEAGDKPVLLIFVHETTRPSIGLTRVVGQYAAQLKDKEDKQALAPYVIYLSDDATAGESALKRMQHAFPKEVPVVLSADGAEGPGALGLNRKVALTILVAKDNKVSANFALVQPSIQADAPKIAKALHAALGEDKEPTLKDLGIVGDRPARGEPEVDLRGLLAPVIKKTATEEEVQRAAAIVEEAAKKNPAARAAVGQAVKRIVEAGKLENYGTPKAQEYLKKWAEEFNK
jgi:hypothetical protein